MEIDFSDMERREAMSKFEELLEETQEQEESLDVTITTGDNYLVSGSLLERIDDLSLDHHIELGGVIKVTLE